MVTTIAAATPAGTQPQRDAIPLCVDLDGTLVRSDTLIEGFFALSRRWQMVKGLVRLVTTGRAAFKQCIMQSATLDPALLPYNHELVAYLRTQKAAGRRLVLATAADLSIEPPVLVGFRELRSSSAQGQPN